MKKKMVVGVLSGVLVVSLAGIGMAAGLLEDIKASLNKGLTITVDGKVWHAEDDQGNELHPITYNNRTYLPVSAVAQALDVPIAYDNTTKTVAIGESIVDEVRTEILDVKYSKVSSMITELPAETTIGNVDYDKVIIFPKVLDSASRLQLFPEKKYAKLTLKVAVEGEDTLLRLLKEGETEIFNQTLKEEDGLQEFVIDISGSSNIAVEVSTNGVSKTSVVKILAESYYQ